MTDRPASKLPDEKAARTSQTYPLTVVLGGDYFRSETPARLSLVDFTARLITTVNRAEQSFTSVSLYSDVGFRAAEFPNRLMIQRVLEAGEAKENPFELVLTEHLFAMRAPDGKTLKPTGRPETLTFTHGKKPLYSRAKADGRKLSEAESAQFTRYLRYQYAMHPDILAAVQARRSIPAEFDIHRYNLEATHYHFAFVQAEEVPRQFAPDNAIAGLKETTTEISAAHLAAAAISPAEFATRCEAQLAEFERDAKAGRILEGLLTYLEYTLSTGRQQQNIFVPYREAMSADAPTQLFIGSIRADSKEAAVKAADTMHALQQKVPNHRRVLKIHEANHLTTAGKPNEGRKLFIEVLTENPCIVGAWKDLGDLYYQGFRADLAWQCWDAGRRFLPTHPQFSQVNEFERQLQADHPEFF